MIVPVEKIPLDTLEALIESFITREGTDYGEQEIALDEKVVQVKKQLQLGIVLIVYDAASESVNLMTKAQYDEWL
ncbi:YheU family protein [Eionea flava]